MVSQLTLFPNVNFEYSLPMPEKRWLPKCINFGEVVLAKGSVSTRARESFVGSVCEALPGARVQERLDVPHNRIMFDEQDRSKRNDQGKRVLVFGELGLKNAVQRNRHKNGMNPYGRYFSVYGGCPHSCSYCYLNESRGTSFSPTVKVFVNLAEIVSEVDRQAREAKQQTPFYLGKFHDGLALDSLTAYSTVLIPFFAEHPYALQVIQTKSANVERLLTLPHKGRTAVSWTLSPPSIAARYETGGPPIEERIDAMARCHKAGYPILVNVAPIIPEVGWQEMYRELVEELLSKVPVQRLYLGGICLKEDGLLCLEQQIGRNNAVSAHVVHSRQNGMMCYPDGLLRPLFRHVINATERVGARSHSLWNYYKEMLVVDFVRGNSFDNVMRLDVRK